MAYGAMGDGVADDTAAINSANTAAGTTGTLFFQPDKTFKTTAGLSAWKCNVQGSGATINFTPADNTTGTAVTIGDGTTAFVSNKVMYLPDIIKTSKYWTSGLTGTDTGLKMWSAINSEIHLGHIQSFSIGAYALGGTSFSPSSPFSYNNMFVGYLDNNKVNLKIDDGGTSYCNEVNWYGGRYGHSGTTVITGCRNISMVKTGSLIPNHHRWWGASLEGEAEDYAVECQGSWNSWWMCRYETNVNIKYFWFRGTAAENNTVFGGYDLDAVVFTDDSTNQLNQVFTRNNWFVKGNGGAGGLIRLSNHSHADDPSIIVTSQFTDPLTMTSGQWQAAIGPTYIGMKALADVDFAIRLNSAGQVEFGNKNGAVTAGIYQSAGTPEASIAANKGSYCADTTNGAGYIKTTDTVNTGWKLVTHA